MLVGAGRDTESSACDTRPAPGGSAPERMRVLMPCAQACWARSSAALQCEISFSPRNHDGVSGCADTMSLALL